MRRTPPSRRASFNSRFTPIPQTSICCVGEVVFISRVDYGGPSHGITRERCEVIILSQVLPHAVNRGYQDWGGETVRLVNGVVPRDSNQLASIIDQARGKWLRVVTGDGWMLTLDREAALRANGRILANLWDFRGSLPRTGAKPSAKPAKTPPIAPIRSSLDKSEATATLRQSPNKGAVVHRGLPARCRPVPTRPAP